jgi:hypothetical protein
MHVKENAGITKLNYFYWLAWSGQCKNKNKKTEKENYRKRLK